MYVSSTRKNLHQILQLNNIQINIHISNWLWSRFLLVDSQTHQRIKCLVTVNFPFKCVILELKKKSSNVTNGFIREMHVDIVLWFKLLFHWLAASHFGHIDRNMVVNVLIFVVFLTTCPMTYLSTSLGKRFCYCW